MWASPAFDPSTCGYLGPLRVALGSVGSREFEEPFGSFSLLCPRVLFGYVQHLGEALVLVRTNAKVAFATAAIIVPGPRGPA